MVSVSITTFNQASYIAQAIESALAQETNFPYEIVVSDDSSSDATRDICAEYAARFPRKSATSRGLKISAR